MTLSGDKAAEEGVCARGGEEVKGPSGKEPQQWVNSYETRTFYKKWQTPSESDNRAKCLSLKGTNFHF